MNMVSEVERIVRAVLKQGGKLQIVFGDGEPVWDLVGVEEEDPRITFENTLARLTMDANTLEGKPPKKGATFEVSFGGDTVHGVYTDDNDSYETTGEG